MVSCGTSPDSALAPGVPIAGGRPIEMVTVTAVSAPGKVLLAGGYLVLDRAYTGLVFGLSARIHVAVQDVELSSGNGPSQILVESPQFEDATWRYECTISGDTGTVRVTKVQDVSSRPVSRNPFVETALIYALNYVFCLTDKNSMRPARITILADSDYYSQPGTVSAKNGAEAHPFLDFGVRLQDAHKTGLGSSAALVTAFTGAVLCHYLSESQFAVLSTDGRALLHNLAQAAHCAAQGKVGSGFDVAAAVYGTCTYRRFSPAILSGLGEPSSTRFAVGLKRLVENASPEQKWDTEIEKDNVRIPKGMALVMCDVDCGSETVGMVKKVLEWRNQDPSAAGVIWDQLQEENETLAKRLLFGEPLELRDSFSAIRKHIRDMGARSGVPIEPPEQTALLDAVVDNVDGVYGGVVPGAGGYDAIVLLIKDDEETTLKLRAFLKEWSSTKGENVKLLGVRGEMEGVRKENQRTYDGWTKRKLYHSEHPSAVS